MELNLKPSHAKVRDDDKEYILRLIGQVITVSLETVKIVNALPDLGLPKETSAKATTMVQ
jgi:hypothetical protein